MMCLETTVRPRPQDKQSRGRDISEAERTALKRLNRGPYPGLDETVGLRLVDLGLAASRPGGIGISRIGREMVINMLLDSRQKEGD